MAKNYKNIVLDPKYVPKKTDKYMSDDMKAYFYNMLVGQRAELIASIEGNISALSESINIDDADGPDDDGDKSMMTQQADTQMKMLDRDKNMLDKIDSALERLEKNTFGYSVISGAQIGIKRMLAQPLATMTVEEREEYEAKEI